MITGIYIPSKNRVEHCYTVQTFIEQGIDFNLVVEPQDEKIYQNKFGSVDCVNIILMPENNQGIAYARNFCKKKSRENNEDFHWQFDDNIKSFKRRINGKNVIADPKTCIKIIEDTTYSYKNIGIAGFCYTTFAFAKARDIDINKQIASACLFNNEPEVWWRSEIVEDTDYCMQVLSQGMKNRAYGKMDKSWCTLLFNRVLIEKPRTMTMKGGNTEIEYNAAMRRKRVINLEKAWPDAFSHKVDDHGVMKIRPSRVWNEFTQQPIPPKNDTIIKLKK